MELSIEYFEEFKKDIGKYPDSFENHNELRSQIDEAISFLNKGYVIVAENQFQDYLEKKFKNHIPYINQNTGCDEHNPFEAFDYFSIEIGQDSYKIDLKP